MPIEPGEYAGHGVSAICSMEGKNLAKPFARNDGGQNTVGWDQLDGQQVSFYSNHTSTTDIDPKMQSPNANFGTAGAPAMSATIIGHPSVENATDENYRIYTAYKFNSDEDTTAAQVQVSPGDNRPNYEFVTDDAEDHIGNDGIVINSVTMKNKKPTGFLPYDSRVEGKSLYLWMSGLLAPIELVKVFERVQDSETVNTAGGDGPVPNSDFGASNDRIRWTQVWAMPNDIGGVPMKYFANLTEMYVYQDDSTLATRTLFYADPGIKF